jgi:dTDP-4-amino-4,6-dideoxygalactose transaminase|tara:strand:- start:6399 stop:7505 length:1107 start_codon:yes stop_codon:yes gene_type:complete
MKEKINLNWWAININRAKTRKDLLNSFDKKLFSQGKISAEVENEICKKIKSKYCILTPSGTSAIVLSLMYFKMRVNDPKKNEVIISDRSWISPAHAAYFLNLKLVFVDTKKDLPLPDENDIISKINKKTLCVICVQLNGRAIDVNYIKNKKKVFILEDAAQSFYSKSKKNFIGTTADIGILSFSMGKIVTSGQGGAVITNSNIINKSIKLLKNNGIENRYVDKWNSPGLNFKFTDIQATILLEQIKKIKETKKKLIKLYLYYKKRLNEINDIVLVDDKLVTGRIPLYIECYSKKKNLIFNKIKNSKKMIRVNYQSLHKTEYFQKFLSNKKTFKNSNSYNKYSFYFPSGPDQDTKKIDVLLNNLKKILN